MSQTVLHRESTFHDRWASSTPVETIAVRPAFEAPTALENRFILDRMQRDHGELRGLRLLDVGCGLGESSVYFALRGAHVTATDLSPGMLATTRALAAHHGVTLRTAVAAADSLPFDSGSFDAVYAANILHHVPDRPAFFAQMARVLRPGGRFYTWDPLAYNPAINLYRRLATEVRTDDEEPLRFDILDAARRDFADVGFRCFWIASLALFFKYYLVHRIDPNHERYWKKIYTESERSLWWWKPLRELDRLLTRVPGLRRWAWNIVLTGRKPGAASGSCCEKST